MKIVDDWDWESFLLEPILALLTTLAHEDEDIDGMIFACDKELCLDAWEENEISLP